jgi:hypothetical protein
MMDNNPRQSISNDPKADRLDHDLDAALANYAAVEPRAGIEQRILANLHAQQKQALVHSWWRWPAIGTLLLVVFTIALLVAWRFTRPSQNFSVHHLPTVTLPVTGTQIASNIKPGGNGPGAPAMRKRQSHTHHPENENASAPKLDVFPSPQPLSEQEKMLIAYVAQHRQQAVLIARARMAELKEDLARERETNEQNAEPNRRPSDQSMNQQGVNQQEHESAGDR